MFQLTYYSKAIPNISAKDISNILEVAIKNNKEHNLTGCLVFIDNTFIQILEGEKEKIETLYSNLLLDPRHTNVNLISKGESEKRFFSEWGMAYYPISKKTKGSEIELFHRNLDILLDLSQPKTDTEREFWVMVKMKLSQNRLVSGSQEI